MVVARRILVAACVILASPWPSALAGNPTAPYTLAVRVAHDGPGSDTLREDVEFRVIGGLDAAHCFERVVALDARADPVEAAALGAGADLLLDIVLSGVEDQIEYDISMAERNDPNASPDTGRRRTARFEVDVAIDLRTLAADVAPLRDRRFHVAGTHRPLVDEDPRIEAQLEAVDEIATVARRLSCSGGPRKLERRIERVRSEAAERR